MNIVILAAGQGKRMHSNLPKVLHPIAGKPLLGHVIDTARSLAPNSLSVVYGHGGDAVRTAFPDADLKWALQAPQLGTGHALQQALPHLAPGGATLMLYGDVPLIRAETLGRLLHAAQDALAILTVELDDPSGYGRIVRGADGSVARIVEQKDATPEERAIREINTGIMAFPTARLSDWLARLSNDNAQGEYYVTDLVAMAVADGVPVRTAQPDAEWEVLGVNSKVQLAELERVAQLNTATRLLEQGVCLADPARLDVRGELVCGRDVFIDVGCVFEGAVELGETVVGPDGRIGPFARLRPGTVLAEDVHIGNFVEVKKSTIAAHSKANHLAYLGDAEIGARVNVGAGTITCNYDGANKHKTVIEDDVFIGSDTQLVAPVVVRRGATLGAGTTLTKEAPADTLTLSRAKQVSIPGWTRPVKAKK